MLHENSDLLIKFRKEDEKNALLTEQNERQVLFCTVTSRLLHDDVRFSVIIKQCHLSTYKEVAGKSYSLEISFTVCQKYSIMMLD